MSDLRDCGGCVAYEEMLDLVAQALGKELFAAHDGHHYEAVRSLVQSHSWMSEDTARMRTVIDEKQAEIDAWKDASGLECGGDPDGVTPTMAREFWDAEAKKIEAFQAQAIEHQADVVALRHDLEVVEHERDQARKELEDWKRQHSQPIHNPPEATGEYVDVMGEMTIPFTVQLPVELCREPIACDDPAIEAALQAVSGHICTYIWGEDKKPAVVYCDVSDQNVEIESDDRQCLEKDSTRLTDDPVNSGSCNDGDLAPECEQS